MAATIRWLNTALFLLLSSQLNPVFAEDSGKAAAAAYDANAALAFSQSVLGNHLGEYTLVNTEGRRVQLRDYLGKPLVISLVYTSCYRVCSMTTRYLAKSVEKARAALGDESFNVITVGFDTPVDAPDTMAHFAKQQGVDMQGWDFLSGDADTIERLVNDVGFRYFRTAKGFDHLVQATIVDGTGKIRMQVYGELINTPHMVEPLKKLVFGEAPEDTAVTGLLKKIRLFCTTYDPATDDYYFDFSLFIGMAIGGSIILFGIIFLVREARANRNRIK